MRGACARLKTFRLIASVFLEMNDECLGKLEEHQIDRIYVLETIHDMHLGKTEEVHI